MQNSRTKALFDKKKKVFYTTPKEVISASEALSKGLLVHNRNPPTAATPQATEFTTPRTWRTSPTSVREMRHSSKAKQRYHFELHFLLQTFFDRCDQKNVSYFCQCIVASSVRMHRGRRKTEVHKFRWSKYCEQEGVVEVLREQIGYRLERCKPSVFSQNSTREHTKEILIFQTNCTLKRKN